MFSLSEESLPSSPAIAVPCSYGFWSFLTPVQRKGNLLSSGKPKGESLLNIHIPLMSTGFSPDGSQQIPTCPCVKKKLPNHVFAPRWALKDWHPLELSSTFSHPSTSVSVTIHSNNNISSDCCSPKSNIKVLGFLLYTRSQRKNSGFRKPWQIMSLGNPLSRAKQAPREKQKCMAGIKSTWKQSVVLLHCMFIRSSHWLWWERSAFMHERWCRHSISIRKKVTKSLDTEVGGQGQSEYWEKL